MTDGSGNLSMVNSGTVPYRNVYFAGRPVLLKGVAVVTDRLGSVVSGSVDYFPYGEEKTSTANPADKFGTYMRDATGLDYAEQRYFSASISRFISVDPYKETARDQPSNLNGYVFVVGDPINVIDPLGLNIEDVECMIDGYPSSCTDLMRLLNIGGGALVASVTYGGQLYTNQLPNLESGTQNVGTYVNNLSQLLSLVLPLDEEAGTTGKREASRMRAYQKCINSAAESAQNMMNAANGYWSEFNSVEHTIMIPAEKGFFVGAVYGPPSWILAGGELGGALKPALGALYGLKQGLAVGVLSLFARQIIIDIGNQLINVYGKITFDQASQKCEQQYNTGVIIP